MSKAIADAAGKDFDEECRSALEKTGELETGNVCVTSAGNLPAKKVS